MNLEKLVGTNANLITLAAIELASFSQMIKVK